MIRFLVFILIILIGCMVLLGATGIKNRDLNELTKTSNSYSVETVKNLPTINKQEVKSQTLTLTSLNVVFFSKIFVLMLIVLMAVLNYIKFLAQKEES